MRNGLIVLSLLSSAMAPAMAQVSIGVAFPNVSIGINLGGYPDLVAVPGYPVYYAPGLDSNYFFYDGMYWVYRNDNWYASSWYNGPWGFVDPEFVPLYVLRIPVRYYRQPPAYFRNWRSDAPPRWGEHWGNAWAQHRSGWDRWNHDAVPARPPLPSYQRDYSGDRYPRIEQQQTLQQRNYRYQPQDPVVAQQYQAQRQAQRAPASLPRERQAAPQERYPAAQDTRPSLPPVPVMQSAPPPLRVQAQQKRDEDLQRQAETQQRRQPLPEARSRGQDAAVQGREAPQEPGRRREPGHERDHDRDHDQTNDRSRDRER